MEFDGNLSLRKSRINKLDYYLNYELSTSMLFFVAFASAAFLPIIYLAAIIFTPYMLFVLFKEKKYGWISFFFIMVIIPYLSVQFFISGTLSLVTGSIVLGLFYLYCFMLKMTTRDWVASENARNELAYKRKLKKLQDDAFANRFNN